MQYDYIIVGGGSAGSVLANRLSKKNSVLVLEAGKPDYSWDIRIHMPALLSSLLTTTTYNWGYTSEPEPYMNGRRIAQPRGKVLGGSSSINGMIWIRGNKEDYNRWGKEKGLKHWDYKHVLPYFKKLETRLKGADKYHGDKGPLKLTTPQNKNPLFKAFFESAKEAGYPLTDDVNGAQQEGFGKFDQTIYRGRRRSAARSYLHPVMGRSNLNVKTKALVNRILFEGETAIGVEYEWKGSIHKVYANKEVLICGGAINSPQLLQLSGIGNGEELEKLGIKVVKDLPGVGENLQDHLEVYIQWTCKEPVSEYPNLNPWRAPRIGLSWLFCRKGAAATNHFEAGGFIKSSPDKSYPNLQYHFLPLAIRYDGTAAKGHGFQVHVGPNNSDVRGSVKIKTKNPKDYPAIKFNYLSTKQEREDWVNAVRLTRKLIDTKAMAKYKGEELSPGKAIQTDKEILDWVAKDGESAYHPSCTCRMGFDDMAVVDDKLKVHGVKNLRIIDASVMPNITNGNIYAPVLMIAEKAADMILNKPFLPSIDNA